MLGRKKRNATLLGAYRNSPYVAQLASYFIADENLRSQYLSQINTHQQTKERPLSPFRCPRGWWLIYEEMQSSKV